MHIVLFFVFTILFIIFMANSKNIFSSTLKEITIFSALLVAGCELLSLFSQLQFWPITIYWLLCGIVLCVASKKGLNRGYKIYTK